MLRSDLVFSVWIFVWCILYFIGIIPYNPTCILLISTIIVFIFIIQYLWYKNAIKYNMTKFLLMNTMIKIVPILLLWWQNSLSISLSDVYFTILFFVIYNIYLQLNGTDMVLVYNQLVIPYFQETYDTNQKTWMSNTYNYIYRTYFTS